MPTVFNCEILQRHISSFYLAVNLFLLPMMHSSVNLFSITSYTQSLHFYEASIHLEILILYVSFYCRCGQLVRDQEPHFLLCYHIIHMGIHEHHPIFSSLRHILLPG